MKVLMHTGGIVSTNSFLVADEASKQAVIFDAPDRTTSPLLDELDQQGWTLVGLWLTHGHFDHIADHKVVTDRWPDAKVLIHSDDEAKMENPRSQFFPLPFVIPPRKADGYLADHQKLRLGSLEFQVIHTPGHAPGHVSFYCPAQKLLIGGDLIIGGSVGRTDLPDSDPQDLVRSIQRIMQLPPDTRLMPGHGEPSTLGQELEENPYVRDALGRYT